MQATYPYGAYDAPDYPATQAPGYATALAADGVDLVNADGDEGLVIDHETWDIRKHDGTVTLVSPKTGEHRTFRIRTVRDTRHATDSRKPSTLIGARIVELFCGTDNTEDYKPFAFVSDGSYASYPAGHVVVWKNYRHYGENAATIWESYADLLNRPRYWSGRGVQYLIGLECRRCGRPLTHPDSIADGLGPVCRTK
jgi:hypothetical protein